MKFIRKNMKFVLKNMIISAILTPGTLRLASALSLNRRALLRKITAGAVGIASFYPVDPAHAVGQLRDKLDEDKFLESGMVGKPMGISGQGTKSKPELGVLVRDGSVVEQDSRTGDVSAEILLRGSNESSKYVPIFISFRSQNWPLATGRFYDVECRDSKTGDGAFLAVTPVLPEGQSINDLSETFIMNSLFGPTGRFSAYGQPTDIQVHQSASDNRDGNYRTLEVSFSTLSQSTQTEIPRHARIIATIPTGARQAVLWVGSASESRWNKGSDAIVAQTGATFRAIPAPSSSLKMRATPRPSFDVVV